MSGSAFLILIPVRRLWLFCWRLIRGLNAMNRSHLLPEPPSRLPCHESGEELRKPAGFREECRQDEEGQLIISGSLGETQKAFLMAMTDMKSILVTGLDYQHSSLLVPAGIFSQKSAFGAIKATVDTSLMLLYAMRSAAGDTLLFHSSTIVKEGKAYLFLGKSGTGKSTHSGLWLKHTRGTRLLNDDNPVVYVTPEGTPMVSGSPWSGKTPCYKNEEYPIGELSSCARHRRIKSENRPS